MKKKPNSSVPKVKFTAAQTQEAIKRSKSSKAIGPDGLSPIMLKNLGPLGIKFLTNIYNKSVNQSFIPNIWKTAKIIPLLKPGKPSDKALVTDRFPFSLHQSRFLKPFSCLQLVKLSNLPNINMASGSKDLQQQHFRASSPILTPGSTARNLHTAQFL